MNTWKAVLAALVIFFAGIVTGATLFRIAQRPLRQIRNIQPPMVDNRTQPNPANPNLPHDPRSPGSPNPTGGLLGQGFIQVLEHQLRLTPEQRERIDKIMTDGQERVRELRARIDPEMRKELQQTREQIRAVLTPDQREQFEQLMKRPPRRNERGDPQGQPDRRLRDQRESRNQPPPMDASPAGEPREPQSPRHLQDP